jgi:hypothetical protein
MSLSSGFNNKPSKKPKGSTCGLLHADLLLGLLSNPEDGSKMFIRNVG